VGTHFAGSLGARARTYARAFNDDQRDKHIPRPASPSASDAPPRDGR
jgi:hypothetical protein